MKSSRAIACLVASCPFCFLTGLFLAFPARYDWGLALGLLAIALLFSLVYLAAIVQFGQKVWWAVLLVVVLVTLWFTLTQAVGVYPVAAGQMVAWDLGLMGEAVLRLKRTYLSQRSWVIAALTVTVALGLGWLVGFILTLQAS